MIQAVTCQSSNEVIHIGIDRNLVFSCEPSDLSQGVIFRVIFHHYFDQIHEMDMNKASDIPSGFGPLGHKMLFSQVFTLADFPGSWFFLLFQLSREPISVATERWQRGKPLLNKAD